MFVFSFSIEWLCLVERFSCSCRGKYLWLWCLWIGLKL